MSTTQQQQPEQPEQRIVKCKRSGCERVGRPWTFQHGHCSTEHWHEHEGRQALSGFKFDHTRCFTCMATLKEIEPPKPEYAFDETGTELTYNPDKDIIETVWYSQETTRRSSCGYQHNRPEATIGEKEVRHKTVTATICGECGNADHRQHIGMIADGHRTAALVATYLTEDDDADDFDTELLHRRYVETGDIELAAGAAIIECRD